MQSLRADEFDALATATATQSLQRSSASTGESVPKTEEIGPWATLPAAARERYPRKNVYFTGEGQLDVYDYLIWRANVRGYKTLSGETARGSAEMIQDLLRRAFLRDMLDQDLNDEFVRWRRAQYEAAGIAFSETFSSQANIFPIAVPPDTPRFAAFIRARWPVSKALRVAIWVRQEGRCAVCRAERRLAIYRDLEAYDVAREADVNSSNDASAAAAIEVAQLVAICEPCHRRMPQRFMPLHERLA